MESLPSWRFTRREGEDGCGEGKDLKGFVRDAMTIVTAAVAGLTSYLPRSDEGVPCCRISGVTPVVLDS